MANVQSNLSAIQSSKSPVEVADTAQRRLFVVYMIFLLIAGLLTVAFTWLTWRAGNKYQEAIKSDADARIEEAKAGAETAKSDAANARTEAIRIETESNEKIARLTKEAEALRAEAENAKTERAEADKQIAVAKENAERAKADAAQATQRTAEISLKVEEEGRKRAEAERLYLELQERIQPRTISGERRDAFIRTIKGSPKGAVLVICVVGDVETCLLADDIRNMLGENGWNVGDQLFPMLSMMAQNTPIGISLKVKDSHPLLPANTALIRALTEAGLHVGIEENPNVQEGVAELSIGVKPLSARMKP